MFLPCQMSLKAVTVQPREKRKAELPRPPPSKRVNNPTLLGLTSKVVQSPALKKHIHHALQYKREVKQHYGCIFLTTSTFI